MNNGPTKKCRTCGEVKKLELFYKNSFYHDKRDQHCKTCMKNSEIRRGDDVSKSRTDYLKKYANLLALAHGDEEVYDDYTPAFDERGFLYVDGDYGIGLTTEAPDLGYWGNELE